MHIPKKLCLVYTIRKVISVNNYIINLSNKNVKRILLRISPNFYKKRPANSVKKHYFFETHRFTNINNALIGAAFPMQLRVALSQDKLAVNDNIAI